MPCTLCVVRPTLCVVRCASNVVRCALCVQERESGACGPISCNKRAHMHIRTHIHTHTGVSFDKDSLARPSAAAYDLIANKLLKWPQDKLFPILDVLRSCYTKKP